MSASLVAGNMSPFPLRARGHGADLNYGGIVTWIAPCTAFLLARTGLGHELPASTLFERSESCQSRNSALHGTALLPSPAWPTVCVWAFEGMSLPPAEPATPAEAHERGWTAPCSDCGIYGVCAQCQDDIDRAVHCAKYGLPTERQGDLFK